MSCYTKCITDIQECPMENGRKFFSVKKKMYIFVAIIVLVVALGTSAITFLIGANQIDDYYKQTAIDNARNAAFLMDGDFLAMLRSAAESEEYQALRVRAESENNEGLIEDYLKENGLWDEYAEIRSLLTDYLVRVEGIEFLYVMAHGDPNAGYDMYLVDDEETPLYETGVYELRENEFQGIDLASMPDPIISSGDWGWLCSTYAPVYDSEGNCVCVVGCDINMDRIMTERASLLISIFAGTIVYTVIIIFVAMFFMNNLVVTPIRTITSEVKNFNPAEFRNYETAGVMDIEFQRNDEISEMYQGIRSMQMSMIDYLKEKTKVENDLRNKDQKINKLSDETSKDALTGAGSKSAFIKKSELIGRTVAKEGGNFAVVMVDMNNLKHINDEYGHKAGDTYITGCCDMICSVFKNSCVYRIGGDEFVVILHADDYENRIALTEKLKSDFEESYSQEDKDPWFRYSAAVGLAENDPDDTTFESVFKKADEAMYEDKASFKSKHGSFR